ncbi:hypothetical protein BAUCODRAFT_35497 [Baudoinia panamericana UAMH 10762]|uniref:Calcineurin-like phosphoesterase domain-containing protein n=1 Tax=Baudoinia panamericana (strain UAMH 10762) TaxID=717646 RepID=M2LJA1_BAUPA|nr:uncharacterized protein BAUCODRAFT_35497 [Baudoinia panamericana UAMH 10762]EMC94312.1 hypothetical protein BAUCODRAFT_35497 [Baudoinia panamericana UAMH 10762]
MTRRITRTAIQIGSFIVIVFLLIFLADSRYKVLPSSIHSALPTHHAGSVITDITVTFCSTTNPFSTCRLDPDKWHRIEKDLYLHSGWVRSAWLHVKRKKEEELKADDQVVVGVRVGRLDPGVGEVGQHNERWESRPGGIWLLRSSKRHDSDSEKAITGVDVLFGADAVDPRPNWVLAQTPLLLSTSPEVQVARLSTRHGTPRTEKETVPRVNKDGKFKILQISDTHFSTGTGVCRDAIGADGQPITNCEADPRTEDFLESVLDDELPDLVVLSGDQIEGPLAPDSQSALFKAAAPLIERSIPYAAIFGNHDSEGTHSLSRSAQMSLLQTLPYSLSEPGPDELAGVGNYYVEVLAPSPSTHSAITVYLLDSHGLSPDEKHYRGYDWIKQDQIDWFRSTSQGLKKAHAKYSHIHLDLAFIHIPLPEYAEHGVTVTGGTFKEGVTAPGFNSHFYDALAEEGVVAVGCGHDHVNDYCALRPSPLASTTPAKRDGVAASESGTLVSHHSKKPRLGPWMCYAGGSGFGGYGGYGGYHRRVRVWEVDTGAGRVVTWKRVACCGEETKRRVDELVLVEGGSVVAPA